MPLYAPQYFKSFRCIASACRHSCCVGWQVRVDEETFYRYRTAKGEIGERINAALVEEKGGAHIALREGKCPFLNKDGLCDIILSLGEGYLSDICTDHPRFRRFLRSRTEIGVGIACEEAARLILAGEEKTAVVLLDGEESTPHGFEKWLLREREALLTLAENEALPVSLRIERLLAYARRPARLLENARWIDFYRRTERLDPTFDSYLDLWEKAPNGTSRGFDIEGGRLLCYFIFRHATVAKSKRDFRRRIALAALAARHVLAITAARGGSLEDLLDTARLYSSEIEYSEENTAALLKRIP